MTKNLGDIALKKIRLKERSVILYWFIYSIPEFFRGFFVDDFPETLLRAMFEPFYKRYMGNNDPVTPAEFSSWGEYEEAYDFHLEIEALLLYWTHRTWKPIDRILDDQMLIRLVKIRHKLIFT